jgi:Xaa-Pro aminopeptidase
VLARGALWAEGEDYAHGTGHGVGAYLGVHEGPQGIHMRSDVPLQPGMVISNEPGFYKPGEYGIRIENLIVVVEKYAVAHGNRPFYAFETLTLAPIDTRLIDVTLLAPSERAWLDAYHKNVMDTLSPYLDAATRDWLTKAVTV